MKEVLAIKVLKMLHDSNILLVDGESRCANPELVDDDYMIEKLMELENSMED
jgi:hypothetical protein